MHATTKEQGRLFGLDLLRFVAIALVLLCHVLLLMRFAWNCAGWSVMAGYVGVGLFYCAFELPVLRWRDRGLRAEQNTLSPVAPSMAAATFDVLPG